MSPDAAASYHADQVRVFEESGVDMVTAITMTNVNEVVGVVRAAKKTGIPVAISFVVETDGELPTAHQLGEAIQEVDVATGHPRLIS